MYFCSGRHSLDVVQAAGVGFESGRVTDHLVKCYHEEHQVYLKAQDEIKLKVIGI